ncbi:putative short-chain dehydrogenase/reductase SDR, NAD(P)-binding domain superfamily [Plasmopara halstedii]
MVNTSCAKNDSRPQVPNNWNASQITSQKGKTVIITGANSGIGYETALELARKGANVVLACRSEERGKEAEKKLREALASTADAGSVNFKKLDVSDLKSVSKFANEFKSSHDRLDLLINNAGVMAVPYAQTVDGNERQFAVNHLGHFALTATLFPMLKRSTPSRVVNVSSIAHKQAKLEHFTSGSSIMRLSDEGYNPIEVYGETKLNNLLFTFELTRKMKAQNVTGVTSVACHPGITSTNLSAAPGSEGSWFSRLLWKIGDHLPLSQNSLMGALPTLYAATAPDVENNDYFGPNNYFEVWGPPKRVEASEAAHDETAAQNLWKESERLAKVKFDV